MIRNNDNNHLISVLNSLIKSYNKATIYGELNISNINILNIIYNILTNFKDSLTFEESNYLSLLYNQIYYTSEDICKVNVTHDSLISSNQYFIQNSSSETITQPSYKYIEYWQEDSITNTITEIIPEINNRVKQNDTYENFSNGKTITYSNIGRICFLLNQETSTNYSIIGELNSDVTSLFQLQYIPELNAVLIVSDNIYSHGDIYIKIIKN